MKVGYRRLCYRAYDNPSFIWISDLEGRFHCEFVWYPNRANSFDCKFTMYAELLAAKISFAYLAGAKTDSSGWPFGVACEFTMKSHVALRIPHEFIMKSHLALRVPYEFGSKQGRRWL